MRVIICNLNMFSNNQTIEVIDIKDGVIASQTVDLNDLPRAVCALAGKYSVEDVKIIGMGDYGDAFADAIREAHELNYGKNNDFNVEVVKCQSV